MSYEKTTAGSAPVTPVVGGHASVADSTKPAKDVKVVALSIDENDDFGSDPYNYTGSHCVLKIDEAS